MEPMHARNQRRPTRGPREVNIRIRLLNKAIGVNAIGMRDHQMETTESPVKMEARRIADQLPSDASWEDLLYRIYVRQSIEDGIKDDDDDRTESQEALRQSFGLPE
jgi:hypothetical protein